MDFLNTKTNCFLAFWILQHVCKTPKGVGKNTKSYFWGILLYSPFIFWIKKSQMD
jgi:hypothetical protein